MFLAIRLARENIRRHRLRNTMIVLGVVIAAFLIALSIIIGDSLSASIWRQANRIKSTGLIISGGQTNNQFNLPQVTTPSLNNQDFNTIRQLGTVNRASASLITYSTLRSEDHNADGTPVVSTNTDFTSQLKFKLASGNWLEAGDSTKNLVVLGFSLAQRLLGTTQSRNQIVNINGTNFTVVGILDKVGEPISLLGYNIDQAAFLNLDRGQNLFNIPRINQMLVEIKDNSAIDAINATLSASHADSETYRIVKLSQILTHLQQLINWAQTVVLIVAVIVILLSSISVVSIMLVNVIERRSEIAIRRAVGATNRDIILQFLVESGAITLYGGVIGVILAYVATLVLSNYLSISLIFSLNAIILGLGIPLVAGIILGLYPAWVASHYDVVASLNRAD